MVPHPPRPETPGGPTSRRRDGIIRQNSRMAAYNPPASFNTIRRVGLFERSRYSAYCESSAGPRMQSNSTRSPQRAFPPTEAGERSYIEQNYDRFKAAASSGFQRFGRGVILITVLPPHAPD